MSRLSVIAGLVCLAGVADLSAASLSAAQQTGSALTGTVTAGPEALEGVLVSARKSGSTITVTVVSDKNGRYSFPAAKLEPGAYALRGACPGIPEPHRAVVTAGSQRLAVAREDRHRHRGVVRLDRARLLQALHIPEPEGAVGVSRDEGLLILR